MEDADGGDRARYVVPAETAVAVAPPRSRSPSRAYAVEPDGTVAELSVTEAEDRIDPAGADRRAWRRRTARSGLGERPYRFDAAVGHSYEAGLVYNWSGEEYVAACTRATARCVWMRAVTYEEALELGIA